MTNYHLLPEAHVAVGKNRVKTYQSNTIFLNNGQEFELELFNPTDRPVGVKVELNGKSISSSYIVVRPGERSYLERFIDEARKFVFATYMVEGSEEAVRRAIAENGSLRISFHREYTLPPSTVTIAPQPWYYYHQTWPYNNQFFCGTTTNTAGQPFSLTGLSGTVTLDSGTTTANFLNVSDTTTYSTGTTTYTSNNIGCDNSLRSVKVETGRIEQGQQSGQSLDSYYGSFEYLSFHTVEFKLMPTSAKPVEISQIRGYCPNCRTRIRKASWKFCSACGEKI